MSFVTFILITGYSQGQTSEFKADTLVTVYSKSLFIWMFEAIVQKGMFLCFNFGNPNFFELVAYTGYKFVVLCIVMLAAVLGGAEYGTMASYGVMIVFGLMYCIFFFMTLKRYQTAHTLAEHT